MLYIHKFVSDKFLQIGDTFLTILLLGMAAALVYVALTQKPLTKAFAAAWVALP